MSGCEVEVIVSIDNDDPYKQVYRELYKDTAHVLIERDNDSAVGAVNKAAEIAGGDIFIVVSDDFDCPRNWGSTILKVTRGRKDFVLKVHDGVQTWIATLPIMDRDYYNRFGYIYHPNYQHLFCDTELTHVADCLSRLFFHNEILFRHNHHTITKEVDDVTRKAEATYHQGKATYVKRVKDRFGIPSLNVAAISPEGKTHIAWLRAAGLI